MKTNAGWLFGTIVLSLACLLGAANVQNTSLKDRIQALETQIRKLDDHENEIRRLEQTAQGLKDEVTSARKVADKAKKFADSFKLRRVAYSRSDLPLGGTIFHKAYLARNKPDLGGKKHKLIFPGIDESATEVACWVLDWEN